ncbi:hypothetical protein X975_04967, partial [Stegodyphus mimosarum]
MFFCARNILNIVSYIRQLICRFKISLLSIITMVHFQVLAKGNPTGRLLLQ